MPKLKFTCNYCSLEFKNVKLLFDHYHEKHQDKGFKLYDIRHRPTGQKGLTTAPSAQEACARLGWRIGDCFIKQSQEGKV